MFPFCVATYLPGSRLGTLLLYGYPTFGFAIFLAPCIAMTHALATVRMRAQACAILFFTLSIVGQSAGPQLTGLISDRLAARFGDDSLRYALLIMCPCSGSGRLCTSPGPPARSNRTSSAWGRAAR